MREIIRRRRIDDNDILGPTFSSHLFTAFNYGEPVAVFTWTLATKRLPDGSMVHISRSYHDAAHCLADNMLLLERDCGKPDWIRIYST